MWEVLHTTRGFRITKCYPSLVQRKCLEAKGFVDCASAVRPCFVMQDLGQVEYILTDKTGTLTENQMEFKACVVDEESFEGSAEV